MVTIRDAGLFGDVLQFLCDEEVILDTGIILKRQPTHGNCCTCQECGHHHDDCVCASNRIVQGLKDLFRARGNDEAL